VLALGAVAYVSVQSSRDARADAERDAAFSARTAAKQLGETIAVARAQVAQVAAAPNIAQAISRPEACTLSYGGGSGFTRGHIDIVGPTGRVACSSTKPTPEISYAGEPWFAAAARGPIFRAPIIDRATGDQSVLAAAPIPGAGGAVALVFAALEPVGPELARLYGGGRQTVFLITTANGRTVLARSVNPARWVGESLTAAEAAELDMAERRDLEGITRFYEEARVPGVGWRFHVGEEKSDVLASAARLRNRQLALILGGLVVLLAAVLLVYRRAALPMKRLGSAARANAAQGTHDAVPVGGPAEVAALGEDINSLIDSIDRELRERQRAEESARASERNYRLLFESSPIPMCICDVETGTILEANGAAVAAYAQTRDELLAARVVDLARPAEQGMVNELLAETKPAERLGPFHLVGKNEAEIEVRITSYGVSFRDRPARFMLLEDVGERERFERRLRQTQRLESLGQLAGGVAHDFNNVLAVIGGFAQEVTRQIAEPDERESGRWRDIQESVAQIEQATESGTRLTRQLLAFARQEDVRPTVLDVNEVALQLTPMLRHAVGGRVQLDVALGDDLWPVEIDRGQLEQVFLNLAVNARDAMPEGGNLTIDTGNTEVDEAYAASRPGVAEGRYVRLRVSDTGTGMDDTTIQHAFEPFYTTKETGTGLGLATVYGIITQAGGRAQIYSEAGYGTTFTALLPAVESAAAAEEARAVEATGGRETVLVVEDEDAVRDAVVETLRRHGYRVLVAAEGAGALELASEHAEPIDVLVTDVVMPRMLGREVAERMSELQPGVRVLYVTGYAHPVLESKGTLEPGVHVLVKPFGEGEFLSAIRRVLDEPVGSPRSGA
jgi:PAS domain S-box-containing protein